MYQRFHPKQRNRSGKWQRLPRTGVGQITHEVVGEWLIEVSHRTVGSTIKREQYTAVIRRQKPEYEESLTGFRSKEAALAAARKRIDLLQHVRKPVMTGPHLKRAAKRDS